MAVPLTGKPRRPRVTWPLWFIGPAVVLFAGFVLLPIVLAVLLSFCSWDGSTAIRFNGVANWSEFIHDSSAIAALERTGVVVIASWLIQEPIAMALGIFAAGRQR